MASQDNPTSERERIEQELVRARQERETFIRQAERQVAMFDGAIFALEKLLGAGQEQKVE